AKDDRGYKLLYDAQGKLCLEATGFLHWEEVRIHLVPLTPRSRDYQYLFCMADSLLDFRPQGEKKILAFTDNRERASRYTSISKDEFVSRFFEQFLALTYPRQTHPGLETTLHLLKDRLPNGDDTDALELEV